MDLKMQETKAQEEELVHMSSRKSSIDLPREQAQTQLEQTKKEFEQMLVQLLEKNNGKRKNVGAIDNLLPQFPKHMTKVMENTAPAPQINSISNEKYRPKFKTEKEKAIIKLKLDEKKIDTDTGRVAAKKEPLPESTKSQAKPANPETKPPETIESKAEGEEPVVEEPKKPRYFPPRRLPNPFESAAQEQERFI